MTAKRFKEERGIAKFIDNQTGKEYSEYNLDEIVCLLNELHEQNQYLKSLKWNQDCINEISISMQQIQLLEKENEQLKTIIDQLRTDNTKQKKKLNTTMKENEQLKEELNKLKKFEYGGEHIRLSINIETGELQRHIYATGQWFGDFDRVLVDNWLSKEDYQRFINRVIEVYNTELKKELEE